MKLTLKKIKESLDISNRKTISKIYLINKLLKFFFYYILVSKLYNCRKLYYLRLIFEKLTINNNYLFKQSLKK